MPRGLAALHAPFAYEGVVRELVARAKYRDRHAALRWLADEMVAELRSAMGEVATSVPPIGVVTWAPTTARRRRARGFDQAEVLAVRIAAVIGCPVRAELRRSSSGSQTGTDREARIRGPRFVAQVRAGSSTPGAVLLVDDVVTTGATLRAAAAALGGLAGRHVLGLCAARTPGDRSVGLDAGPMV